ncbi:unnamed protein product [Trifolium pratense]|uniref:Uncharacterized protein n=1 Tax=Trifolium pratense TaxID=57577 RepID=A0ACB0KK82_TRIPR|nr:unnamed protein product [Trifolium pratense]
MVLVGKLSTELGIKTSADKFFKLFASEIHELQNICGSVHETNLHEDGKVQTCHESFEEIDEKNKKIVHKIFGPDIDKSYKIFKLIIEVFDKGDGGATVKWTVEYEKINEDIDPPYGWLEYVGKCTRDIDAHFLKQAASV